MPRNGYGFIFEVMAGVHSKPKKTTGNSTRQASTAAKRDNKGKGCWVRHRDRKHSSASKNDLKSHDTSSDTRRNSSDNPKHINRADSVMESETSDDDTASDDDMASDDTQTSEIEARQNKECSSDFDARKMKAMPDEIIALQNRQASLERKVKHWRRAYEEIKQERDGYPYDRRANVDHLVESANQRNEIEVLRKEVKKLEKKLEGAENERVKAQRGYERELSKAKHAYKKLVSDCAELLDTIHDIDNELPSMVIAAARKLADKLGRPWKDGKHCS
ncbi:hypothetical protein HDK64DRAFT_258933 [Phyllosticta capitalensis]